MSWEPGKEGVNITPPIYVLVALRGAVNQDTQNQVQTLKVEVNTS